MNDVTKYDPQTGEIASMSEGALDQGGLPLAVQLAKAELDQAVATAHAFPRSMQRVRDRINDLVMLDEETAQECVYALPRGGKPIKGPSVRFAEIVASQYGNCKVGTRVVEVNRIDKYVEAEGVFIDLESGMHRTARIRRRIVDRSGRLFNDDMIIVTGNAACSIALREAIMKGVPKALWRAAYQAAEGVIAGDIKTLAERRHGAITAFAAWGVKPEQIFASLEIDGMDDLGMDEIATLLSMHRAIKSGEQKVEDYFPAKADQGKAVEASKGTAAKMADIAKGKDAKKEADHKAAEQNREDDAARQKMQDERDAKAKAKKDAAEEAEKQAENGEVESAGDTGPEKAEKAASGDDDGPSEDPETKAYHRGRKAHGRGTESDACPPDLKRDSVLADAWAQGWRDARDDAEGGE